MITREMFVGLICLWKIREKPVYEWYYITVCCVESIWWMNRVFLFDLFAVGAEADDKMIEHLLSEVKGKDITELIASGRSKLASVPSGGGAVAYSAAPASGGGAAAPAAAESKKEEKVEEKEESDDVSLSLSLWL